MGVSCDPPAAGDVKWRVPPPGDLPVPKLLMVMTAHGPLGPAAAFFTESMRRDAITGGIIVIAL